MDFDYYDDCELEFYINTIDNVLKEYNDKVEMLENLKDEFVTELKRRGRD